MHGLIFVTWEHYLAERFGEPLLAQYRLKIGETSTSAPLVNHIYDDAQLLAGVAAATQLTRQPVETLLREYGRYFILNGLTSHRCAYLLNDVQSARNLILTMRQAHMQISQVGSGITPPLFIYEALPDDPGGLVLIYDSPRQLCDVLAGCIDGAAERYGEQISWREAACMKRGAAACRFQIRFLTTTRSIQQPQPQQQEHWQTQRDLAELVYAVLPEHDGSTLAEIYERLRQQRRLAQPVRLRQVFDALNHLQHAGWADSSTIPPGAEGGERRYWRLEPAPPGD